MPSVGTIRGVRALTILGALALALAAGEAGAKQRPAASWAKPAPGPSARFEPGEVIVAYEQGEVARGRQAVRGAPAVRASRPLGIARLELVRLRPGESVRRAVRRLAREPGVAYAEPNYVRELQAIPNDPLFGKLWGLHNTGGGGRRADADIDAPEAWDLSLGDGVVVAVLDTGVNYEHEDLAGQLFLNPGETGMGREDNGIDDDGNGFVDDWRGWDFGVVDGHDGLDLSGPDNDPRDHFGHGTHVSGTIAAAADNGVGIAGVAPKARILPVRLGDYDLNVSRSVRGIKYAHALGAKVANMSYGGWGPSRAELDAIRAASDTLFVIAAGNEGMNVDRERFFPCAYPARNIICVAASTPADRLADFSNYGRNRVDLAAPGTAILSAAWRVQFRRVFTDGFREPLAGTWRRGGTNNTWGRQPVRFPGDPVRKRRPNYALSDSPGKPYRNNADATVTTGPLDLSGGRNCMLNFLFRGRTEPGPDRMLVEVRRSGGPWEEVASYSGRFPVTLGEIDLSAYDGEESLRLRFRLKTDGSVRAPGFVIDSLYLECPSNYMRERGTSMAAPHVAGAAALLMAHDPSLTPFEARAKLVGSADRRPSFRRTIAGGRLNAAAALTYEDAQPPETSVVAFKRVGKRGARIRLGADELVRRYECRLDEAPFAKCPKNLKLGPLAMGAHVFAARAVDAFGNTDPTPAVRRFRIR